MGQDNPQVTQQRPHHQATHRSSAQASDTPSPHEAEPLTRLNAQVSDYHKSHNLSYEKAEGEAKGARSPQGPACRWAGLDGAGGPTGRKALHLPGPQPGAWGDQPGPGVGGRHDSAAPAGSGVGPLSGAMGRPTCFLLRHHDQGTGLLSLRFR